MHWSSRGAGQKVPWDGARSDGDRGTWRTLPPPVTRFLGVSGPTASVSPREATIPTVVTPLTVVVATREGAASLEPVLAALVPQLRASRADAVVICGSGEAAPSGLEGGVTWIATEGRNLLELRQIAIEHARGVIIAFGEDHAVPGPGWVDAILRAHREHPYAAMVVGCLVNATDATVAGRANFLAFAAPFTPPMKNLPGRPPPFSTVSIKQRELEFPFVNSGDVESKLLPKLIDEGAAVCDDRIVAYHHQDHGTRWSVANAFVNARANYGYAHERDGRGRRNEVLRWICSTLLPRQVGEVWAGRPTMRSPLDLVLGMVLSAATTLGALVGTVSGPGRAAERVA